MSRREQWQELYQRFDPERPADSRWRADRPHSPARRIVESLDMPFGDPRILLTGTVGTGKTTELLRVAETRKDREVVVFLDLARHFTEVVRDPAALDRISSWEVCFLAGVALIATIKERLGYEFPEQYVEELKSSWNSIARATETPAAQLDIAALAKATMGVMATTVPALVEGTTGTGLATGFTFSSAVAGAISKWTLPLGRSKQFLPDQDPHVQTLLACVNLLVGQVQAEHRRVLFVIDGLDRIRSIERSKELFVDSQLISQLACPVVVCAPFALRYHPSAVAVRGFEPLALVNEPVLSHEDPTQHGEGVHFFCELFARRTADLSGETLIARPLLEEMAYRSGGRTRDFVRFIQELAKEAWLTDVPAATQELVQKVLDHQRRIRETGLNKGHIELLESIANDPEHRLPANPLAQELLSYQLLLPYPNESEWYYPHPLLTIALVQQPSPAPPKQGPTGLAMPPIKQAGSSASNTGNRRFDIAVYNRSKHLTVIGEIKRRLNTTASWAAEFRRNTLAHGQAPTADLFVVVVPERLYLWQSSAPAEAMPSYEVDMRSVLNPYFERIGTSPKNIDPMAFELLISLWLQDLALAEPKQVAPELLHSGLFDAVSGGQILREVSA